MLLDEEGILLLLEKSKLNEVYQDYKDALKKREEAAKAKNKENEPMSDSVKEAWRNIFVNAIAEDYLNTCIENPSYLFYVKEGTIMCFSVTSRGSNEVTLLINDSSEKVVKRIVDDLGTKRMVHTRRYFMEIHKFLHVNLGEIYIRNYRYASDLYRRIVRDSFESYQLVLHKPPLRMTDSPDEWTFKYINKRSFSRVRTEYPAWDEFLNRLSHPDYFMTWVGSLFDPNNRSRRILVLKGKGHDGKSNVMQVIRKIYGKSGLGSISNNSLNNSDFTMGSLYDKSFITYGDCNNHNVIRHELIKNLSGNDSVFINRKGEQGFEATVYAHIWISTNYNIKITKTEKSELSRLLLIHVQEPNVKEEGDPNWKKNLWKQHKAFIRDCIKLYEEKVGDEREEFPLDDDYKKSISGYIMDSKEEHVIRECKKFPEWLTEDGVVEIKFVLDMIYGPRESVDIFDEERVIKYIESKFGAIIETDEDGLRVFKVKGGKKE